MPARLAALGSGEAHRLAGQADLAVVGLDHARDDLDQRRLAGAVLAQHGVDRAGAAGEVDLLERPHAAIALGDAAELEEGRSASASASATRLPVRTAYCTLSALLPMISTAVMLTSQGGNSLAVKKLSVRSDQ